MLACYLAIAPETGNVSVCVRVGVANASNSFALTTRIHLCSWPLPIHITWYLIKVVISNSVPLVETCQGPPLLLAVNRTEHE